MLLYLRPEILDVLRARTQLGSHSLGDFRLMGSVVWGLWQDSTSRQEWEGEREGLSGQEEIGV